MCMMSTPNPCIKKYLILLDSFGPGYFSIYVLNMLVTTDVVV